MEIVTVPHLTLRQSAKEVKQFDKKFFKFLRQLSQTLHQQKEPQGVGLAAPQVAKTWRTFVAVIEAKKNQDVFFINPRLLNHSKETTLTLANGEELFEGCLSIPKIYGPVPRYSWVEVEYLTPDFTQKDAAGNPVLKKITEKFTDFDAKVIQHENDHLDGILFTDYSKKLHLPIFIDQKNSWVEIENREEILNYLG